MNDAGGDIRFLVADAPRFPESEARKAARRLFGVDGDLEPLDSDRDLNFRLTNDRGRWVLKFFHPDEDAGVIDFQTGVLAHIAAADPGLRAPATVPARNGKPWGRARAPDGRTSIVRLLTWVDGVDLSGVPDTRRLRRSAGATAARLDRALAGFFHPRALHALLWDVRQAPALRRCTGDIADRERRRLVETALDRFIENALPRWPRLRSQTIHNDANKDNLVVDPERPEEVVGAIDFGDAVHGPIAAELAMTADTFALDAPDPVERIVDVATGFDAVLPLEEEEVDVLFDAIAARFAVLAAIVARRAVARKGSPAYLPGSDATAARSIDALLTIGREAATDRFRDALRMPARCAMGAVDAPESAELPRLLARRRRYLGKRLSLFYRNPLHIERGRGAFLYDANGRAFLDAYNNVPSVGHCHPHVANAIARQAAALCTNTRYVYSILADYAERLQASMPAHLRCCVMVNSGSEANDVAWRMAKLLTGRSGAIVMNGAYHGITDAIADLSPEAGARKAEHVAELMSPDPYRGPWGRGEKNLGAKYAADADRAIADLEARGHPVAAFVVDSSFCTDGIPDAPGDYLGKVAAKVRRAGGMVIADEVQFGFGRPGTHMWGFQRRRMRPDIVTVGKPAGDGFPLGAAVTTPAILDAFGAATGLFSTFGGNPVACAAGLAVLDAIEREGLMENARTVGAHLLDGLRGLMDRHEAIGDARGCGFMLGVELVKDRETKEPDPERTVAAQNRMRELGVLVGREGPFGNVFKIRPPLAFDRGNADSLVAAMDRAMSETEGR